MKVNVEVNASRCEAGNMDARVTINIDTANSYGGSAPPLVGMINAAIDSGRKAIVSALEADQKTRMG